MQFFIDVKNLFETFETFLEEEAVDVQLWMFIYIGPSIKYILRSFNLFDILLGLQN